MQTPNFVVLAEVWPTTLRGLQLQEVSRLNNSPSLSDNYNSFSKRIYERNNPWQNKRKNSWGYHLKNEMGDDSKDGRMAEWMVV